MKNSVANLIASDATWHDYLRHLLYQRMHADVMKPMKKTKG